MEVNCAASEVSCLSDASSWSEHIAFLTETMGMDKASAGLLYRTERLQEKGQLKQAIKYYESVLATCPDCTDAIESLRIVSQVISEEEEIERKTKLSAIQEKSEVRPTQSPTVTEMDISWSGREDLRFDYYPDPDECAFRAAQQRLNEIDYGNSLLKLILNKKLTDECNLETSWETVMSGRARFQVTLIRDEMTEAESVLEDVLFQALMARHSLAEPPAQEPKNFSRGKDCSDTRNGKKETTGSVSISTASQFADAPEFQPGVAAPELLIENVSLIPQPVVTTVDEC